MHHSSPKASLFAGLACSSTSPMMVKSTRTLDWSRLHVYCEHEVGMRVMRIPTSCSQNHPRGLAVSAVSPFESPGGPGTVSLYLLCICLYSFLIWANPAVSVCILSVSVPDPPRRLYLHLPTLCRIQTSVMQEFGCLCLMISLLIVSVNKVKYLCTVSNGTEEKEDSRTWP